MFLFIVLVSQQCATISSYKNVSLTEAYNRCLFVFSEIKAKSFFFAAWFPQLNLPLFIWNQSRNLLSIYCSTTVRIFMLCWLCILLTSFQLKMINFFPSILYITETARQKSTSSNGNYHHFCFYDSTHFIWANNSY